MVCVCHTALHQAYTRYKKWTINADIPANHREENQFVYPPAMDGDKTGQSDDGNSDDDSIVRCIDDNVAPGLTTEGDVQSDSSDQLVLKSAGQESSTCEMSSEGVNLGSTSGTQTAALVYHPVGPMTGGTLYSLMGSVGGNAVAPSKGQQLDQIDSTPDQLPTNSEADDAYSSGTVNASLLTSQPHVAPPGYVFLNMDELQSRTFIAPQGTPVLVLTNTDKGTYEASVVIDAQGTGNASRQLKLQAVPNVLGQHAAEGITQQIRVTDTNNQDLDTQKDSKQGQAEKVYVCDEPGCGRTFSTLGYMKYHQAVHSGHKQLRCNFEGCGRKFAWPAHLKYHQLTHTGERPYVCTEDGCNKSFYTVQRLNVHKRTHTGDKPFKCEEPGCGKCFTTAGNLKNHSRIHSGERPYVCDEFGCGRRFAEHSSLRKHKLVHSGEKPFECKICGKLFSQSGSRNVHLKRHQLAGGDEAKDSTVDRNIPIELENQNMLVLQQSEEEMLQYQEFQGSESVVFSHAVADHVVTVTTQPAEGADHLELAQSMLGPEEVLPQEDSINGESAIPTHTSGANVVVLSQPQEMVSMATSFHHSQQGGQEEIVYENELLHAELDHEEIANNLSHHELGVGNISGQEVEDQPSLTESSVTETDKTVSMMDPMMESDDENETEDETGGVHLNAHSGSSPADKLVMMCD